MTTQFGRTRGQIDTATAKAWDKQDHSQCWDDGGATAAILEEAAVEIRKLIASEAKAAVHDYMGAADLMLGVSGQGELLVGCRLWNENEQIIVKVGFLKLIAKALDEMTPIIGTDPEAQALLSALVAVGNQLSNIGRARKPAAADRPAAGHVGKAITSTARRPQRQAGEGITY